MSFAQAFDAPDALAAATLAGHVALSAADPYRGHACLLLTRSREAMETQPTSATLPAFPVRDGLWDVSVALRARLHSPDSSYNGTVRLEVFGSDAGPGANAGPAQIERHEIGIIAGDKGWTPFRKRLELPPEATTARFTITMEKAWGEFAADALACTFAGPSLRTVTAITFASEAVGNLFYPDQPLRFTVSAVCRRPRAADARSVVVTVRDYWGAEHGTRTVALPDAATTDKGRPVYRGVLDLADLPIELGKYYELHAAMPEPDLPEPARDSSAFAVLPEAVTRQHPPFDVPFTASGWNPGVPGFFPLCDRLGLRVANVYSRWSAEPPYAFTAPGIEIVKSLGMGALLSTPVNVVERRAKGYEAYDETCMREGARGLVAAFADQLPIALRVGNEPHPVDDDDVRRMIRTYRAVYEGAKAAKPDIVVTATSCGPEDAFFRLGYQDTHDVYIFHQYADAQIIHADFARYEALVAQYGKRRPVWSTELGLNSQGMSRSAVAIQLVKVFTNFFANGGANASWFGIMWPDPDALLVGTNGDSFDIFNSKYCLYSPKLTAIAEYHTVNAICVKKVVAQRSYPGGEVLTLFRDSTGKALVVAWNDAGCTPVGLPLGGVGPIKATRLDGAGSRFEVPADRALTLALSTEPYLLEFDGPVWSLPESLAAPALTLAAPIEPVVKGGRTRLQLTGSEGTPTIVTKLPPGWALETLASPAAAEPPALASTVDLAITAPLATDAREGRVLLGLGEAVGELYLAVPVVDALAVRFVPAPFVDGKAGMAVAFTNRGVVDQQLQWSLTMPETYAMSGGSFKLKEPSPFTPAFTDPAAAALTVPPGQTVSADVRAANLNPLSLYQARLEWTVDGQTHSRERLFGGCVGVPRVTTEVRFDGKLGDPAWQHAAVVRLDQPEQVAKITPRTARWDGPDDLSGAMYLMWDDTALYLGMSVRDDIHCQPEVGSLIWRGDGLQFLVDPCRDSDQKPGKYDYLIALTRDGAQAWCNSSADAVRAPSRQVHDFRFQVTPTGNQGDMVYEVAIPWQRLSPFQAAPGANLGLAMIINNDDGQIRDSFIAWFGCAHSKQLSMNGDLILLP